MLFEIIEFETDQFILLSAGSFSSTVLYLNLSSMPSWVMVHTRSLFKFLSRRSPRKGLVAPTTVFSNFNDQFIVHFQSLLCFNVDWQKLNLFHFDKSAQW